MASHQIMHDYARWNSACFLCSSLPKVLGHLMFSFKGMRGPGWGVLFHRLSFFTLLVPCGSCSVSFFSHGWLIAYPPSSLRLPMQSPCSALNSPPLSVSLCLLRFSWVTESERHPSPHLSFPPWPTPPSPPGPPPSLCASRSWKTTGAAGPPEGGLSGGQRVQTFQSLLTVISPPLRLQIANLSPNLSKPCQPTCPFLHLYLCTCSTSATTPFP